MSSGSGPAPKTYRHKGEELNAIKHPYEKAMQCLRWAEEMRDAWYEGKIASGGGDAYYMWKNSIEAKDFIGLEQMYSRWAAVYFAQCTAYYAAKS